MGVRRARLALVPIEKLALAKSLVLPMFRPVEMTYGRCHPNSGGPICRKVNSTKTLTVLGSLTPGA
jgi:hypothetical protein